MPTSRFDIPTKHHVEDLQLVECALRISINRFFSIPMTVPLTRSVNWKFMSRSYSKWCHCWNLIHKMSRKFSIIWGKTHFSLFPEVPSWNRLNDRGPRTNSTGSVRSQSPLLNQFGQGRDLVELTGSILQILPKRDA